MERLAQLPPTELERLPQATKAISGKWVGMACGWGIWWVGGSWPLGAGRGIDKLRLGGGGCGVFGWLVFFKAAMSEGLFLSLSLQKRLRCFLWYSFKTKGYRALEKATTCPEFRDVWQNISQHGPVAWTEVPNTHTIISKGCRNSSPELDSKCF